MPNLRVCLVPAVNAFRDLPSSYYGTAAFGGAASGPAGNATMTFFCLYWPRDEGPTTRQLFGRGNFVNAGWGILVNSAGNLSVLVYNSTPAAVQVTATGLAAVEGTRSPYLVIASYQDGVLTFWVNGTQIGTATLGTGFTSFAGPTMIGARSSGAIGTANKEMLSDSGMLYTFDPTTFVNAVYGNGIAGLTAMWLDDLRNGRYLTWPRAAVLNSDWYWAARDTVTGLSVSLSWMDRHSATPMLRFGTPQGASFAARAVLTP